MPRTIHAQVPPPHLKLGAHMSIAGGMHTAVERAVGIGCAVMQVFVKNASQWGGKQLDEEMCITYKNLLSKSNIDPVMAHGTYLINLAAVNPEVRRRSIETCEDELRRCERLRIAFYNIHPGSHMGAGVSAGIERIAEALNVIHERTDGLAVTTVLETTAGQ